MNVWKPVSAKNNLKNPIKKTIKTIKVQIYENFIISKAFQNLDFKNKNRKNSADTRLCTDVIGLI